MNLPNERAAAFVKPKRKKARWLVTVCKNYDLYLLLLPGLAFLILFKYVPMYGISIAFEKFNIFKGVLGSPWVGLFQFQKLFSSPEFYRVLGNTLLISLYKIVFLFPLPIIIAVLLNEIRLSSVKRTIQTVIYLPHFLSWVIVSGIVVEFLSPSTGAVNQMITALKGQPISFLMDNHWFRTVLVASDAWKGAGYGAIVYLSSIAGIDQSQYEAARVDGAGRIRQIFSITLPNLWPIILLMLIMNLGQILNVGTEQILLLYNPSVYDTGDVIGTYVYRQGISQMNYSYSTAVGLFESVVGFLLVMSGNYLSKKTSGRSIW